MLIKYWRKKKSKWTLGARNFIHPLSHYILLVTHWNCNSNTFSLALNAERLNIHSTNRMPTYTMFCAWHFFHMPGIQLQENSVSRATIPAEMQTSPSLSHWTFQKPHGSFQKSNLITSGPCLKLLMYNKRKRKIPNNMASRIWGLVPRTLGCHCKEVAVNLNKRLSPGRAPG